MIERFGEPFCSERHAEEFTAGVRAARVDAAARRPGRDHTDTRPARPRGRRWLGWIAGLALGLLAIAFVAGNSGINGVVPIGGFLLTALVLLACPLAMYFMMRGMGGMHRGGSAPPHNGGGTGSDGSATDSRERRSR